MDATTAAGASPESVSEDILKAILRDKRDVILAPLAPKCAYYLRHWCSPLYFWIMARRAKKLSTKPE